MNIKRNATSGFSLIELMIVVAIIGILVTLVYPSYQGSVTQTRRAEAKSFLMQAMALQERNYTQNNTYTTTLSDLGYLVDGNGKVDSENGHYKIGAASCNNGITSCVALSAVPQASQAANDALCATLSYSSTGTKTTTGTGSAENCW